MFKRKLSKMFLAASCLLVFANAASAGPLTFQAAVAEYKAGKYQSALSMFKQLSASSPTNALTHYWMALCQHQLGHTEQAKKEYQFVVNSGDARLKPLAEAGLGKMSGVRTSGSSTSPATASGTPAGSPSQTTSANKVKKIIEFYADW